MKILIIKLGALGDVLRTTPLLEVLGKQHPLAEIHWLVEARHAAVLEGNPRIKRVHPHSPEALRLLAAARWDLAVNLDKEPEALEAITRVQAARKMGFGKGPGGAPAPIDPLSDYAWRLGIDDELKFRQNKKTYQEISFEQVGLKFALEEYQFFLDSDAERFAQGLVRQWGRRPGPLVGLNTGAGTRFAGKVLPEEKTARLAEWFHEKLDAQVILLGGEEELARNERIRTLSRVPVIAAGSHPIRRFAGIVKACDLIVSGDTTAMHIAIAVKTPVVAYFASTCAAEIELYGRGRKVEAVIPCAPCYLKDCPIDERCMADLPLEALTSVAKELLAEVPAR